ncbi:MAG TPA: hypothetical protein VFZ59_00205 [Verrucomicrobiae bacterium]|nr:hypothetical protein [Verrucomicrobiae bacterium]
MKTVSLLLFLVIAMLVSASVTAQTSSFTYQGQLKFNGTPVNGVYDFMFRLMNDPVNGTAAPVIPINPGVIVSNGIFTTGMDFGMENFAGGNLWLEVSVRTNNAGLFTTLSPRQLLTSTPYAVRAFAASNLLGALPAGQINGTILNASLPASPSFSGTVMASNFSGSGANVTNVNALMLNGLNSSNFWKTTGNAGTMAANHFLGLRTTSQWRSKSMVNVRCVLNPIPMPHQT